MNPRELQSEDHDWWLVGQGCSDCPWSRRWTVPAVRGKRPKINRVAQRAHEKSSGHRVATGSRRLSHEQVMEPLKLRPEVQWFAEQMELRLRANDWKGGRQDSRTHYLWGRLSAEQAELYQALFPLGKREPEKVISEAADVANFAMMLADVHHKHGEAEPL